MRHACLCACRAREIDQGSSCRTRAYAFPVRPFVPPVFYTPCARTLIPDHDSLSLSLSKLFSSTLLIVPVRHDCIVRRNTVTYPHGNRYSARGYRTLISSCASRSHIPGFVETVHRAVSFGYSERYVSVAGVLFPGNNRTSTFVSPLRFPLKREFDIARYPLPIPRSNPSRAYSSRFPSNFSLPRSRDLSCYQIFNLS